jgi:hypothetical protein
MAAHSAAGSRAGTSTPVRPSSTASGVPPEAVANHGQAQGHRLERHHGEGLVPDRGQDERVVLAVGLGDGRPIEPAEEPDGQARRGRLQFRDVGARPLPRERQREKGPLAERLPEGGEQDLRSLLGDERAHEEEPKGGAGARRLRRGSADRRLDRPVEDVQAIGRQPLRLHEPIAQEAARHHEAGGPGQADQTVHAPAGRGAQRRGEGRRVRVPERVGGDVGEVNDRGDPGQPRGQERRVGHEGRVPERQQIRTKGSDCGAAGPEVGAVHDMPFHPTHQPAR